MGAHNPYDNFPELHRGRSFSKDFERIDTLKMGDKILVEDARTGRVMYCYVNQLKEIDPEFGEYLKTASISEDGSTLTLTKNDGTQIVFHGGSGSAEGAVRFDEVQTLTDAQKGVARGNIGAISTSEMAAAILEESRRAQEAEERITTTVQGETERAMQTEAELSNNILAEQTRAQGAESALSQRIDTIIQGRNVRDIVGNYDELLAYDTSTLGDNDIVMVLLDATKSGHTTYYRWKEAESEWEFIGGLAFTYTKTEIDEKFAALHIVLPTIPTDAVEHPEDYQELLAQVDSVVRSAGSDASFKMPVRVVDGISGNVDVTFVKSNPAHLYLGIFADDMSTLYHITRTTSTPRTYTLQIVEKVFATTDNVVDLESDQTINGQKFFSDGFKVDFADVINDATDTTLAHWLDGKADKSYVDDRHVVLNIELGEEEETEFGKARPILNAEQILKQIQAAPDGASFYIYDSAYMITTEAAAKQPFVSLGNWILYTTIEGLVSAYALYTDGTQYAGYCKKAFLEYSENKVQSIGDGDEEQYPSTKAVVDYAAKKSELTELNLKVGKFSEITPTLSSGVQIATLKKEVEGQEVETPLYAPQGGSGSDLPLSVVNGKLCITFNA